MKNRYLIVMGLVLLLACQAVPSEAQSYESDELHRVLMISAYSPGFMTFFDQVEGIREAFSGENIQLDIEYMDTKRFYEDENLDNFYSSLVYKLEKVPEYDLVIAADDNALRFVLDHYEQLFGQMPLVFLGINDHSLAEEAGRDSRITGIVEGISVEGTVELARALIPEASRIVALTDPTPTGQGDLATFNNAMADFGEMETLVLDLSALTFGQLLGEMHELTETDIILLLSMYADSQGRRIVFSEGVDLLNEHCDQPVFHIYEHGIGGGLVGGEVVSHKEQGRLAGDIALRIMNGENPAQIPIVGESPNKVVLDAQALKFFNLDKGDLPDHAVLINQSSLPILKYWPYVLGALLLAGAEAAMIFKLRSANKRLSMVEGKLLLSNTELERSNRQFFRSSQKLKETEEKIRQLIYFDSLTGLRNRYAMTLELDRLISASDEAQPLCVMFLDIDNFKIINDTYGHDVGDEVIQINGTRLRELLSDNVSIGRFGGDEFLIVLKEDSDRTRCKKLIEQIVTSFKEPVHVGEVSFDLTVSIGAAWYPEHGASGQELIKKADLALYRAKEAGRDMAVLYSPKMSEDFFKRVSFQRRIREAMRREEFYLNYQPVVDINTSRIRSVEALIRWRDDRGELISPLRLIKQAEEMGVIEEIGYWVIREAARFARRINLEREGAVTVAVNVSPIQLHKEDFFDTVMEILEREGALPEWFSIEVTETTIISSMDRSVEVLNRFREVGFRISLDDFGTGYSSLKYFNQLPIDTLKIDKTFIDDILESQYDRDLVSTIIKLAHTKGSKVVAEGVEREDQLEALSDNQCDLIQGYLFSKPLGESEIFDMIEKGFLN